MTERLTYEPVARGDCSLRGFFIAARKKGATTILWIWRSAVLNDGGWGVGAKVN